MTMKWMSPEEASCVTTLKQLMLAAQEAAGFARYKMCQWREATCGAATRKAVGKN